MTAQEPDHYILDDGTERWELDNKLHRLDGPALILPDGTETWYLQGDIHRGDGGPAITRAHGTREWWRNGLRHREDGPAIDTGDPATSRWYLRGSPMPPEMIAEKLREIALAAFRQQGEEIAEAIKDGLQNAVVPMKPLKFG